MRATKTLSYSLQLHNPWWTAKGLILEDLRLKELETKKYVYKHPILVDFPFDKDCLLTLRGPRRVGKTTILKQLIRRLLLTENISPERIFFYSCDEVKDFSQLSLILNEYLDWAKALTRRRLFILLDEISFVKEWQRSLKHLADQGRLRNASVLVTGSSSLDLLFSSERLPGRRGAIKNPDRLALPLSFSEFTSLVKPLRQKGNFQSGIYLAKYRKLFNDYLICGGFPAVINEYFQKGYISSIQYETYLQWIEGDLHKLGKSEELMYKIIARFRKHLTSNFSWYKVAKEAGIGSHATVIEYADILKKMFVIFETEALLVSSKLPDPKKNRKVYFLDPFILNACWAKLEGMIDEAFNFSLKNIVNFKNKPVLVENTLGASLKRKLPFLFYGKIRDKEVDFVAKKGSKFFFFESKYEKKVKPGDFNWLKKIVGKRKLTVLSQQDFFQEGNIKIVPAEIFLGYEEQTYL